MYFLFTQHPWIWLFIFCLAGCQAQPVASSNENTSGDEGDVVAVRVETVIAEIAGGTGGVAVDQEGNVYSADFGSRLGGGGSEGGHRVHKITPAGEAGIFSDSHSGASGNCFDSEGNLFQSSIRGNFISKISPTGESTVFVRKGIVNPVGIAIDEEDNLFVCNCGGGSIQKVTKDGESSVFAKSNLLKCPNGIVFDGKGNLYTANFYNGDVLKITPQGEVSKLATVPGNNNGHLTFFRGKLFVIARSAHQIYQVTLDGKVSVFAGSGERGKADGKPLEATFSLPNDLGVSPDGKYMYVNEVAPTQGDPNVLAPTRVRRIVLEDAE